MIIITLESCSAEIDPSAANSFAGVLAVLFEYLFAFVSLLIVMTYKLGSFAFVTYSIYLILINSDFQGVNPVYMLMFGLLWVFASLFWPNKYYEPMVFISKKTRRIKQKNSDSWVCDIFKQVVSGVLVGIILIVINNLCR